MYGIITIQIHNRFVNSNWLCDGYSSE